MSWLNFLTGGASKLVDSIGEAIDKNITSDEERGRLRNELAKINQDFILKAYEFESKQAETTARDRETARNREIELAKAGKKNITMNLLVAAALLGSAWVIWYLLTNDIRERELAFMILGFLIATVKDIYGYFFGSSHGSAIKTDIINKMN